MADKRITELTNEKLVLGDGDYTIVDSNEGTFKFKLKRIMDAIPAIDDSLSQEGEAADAKAVGDEIADVKRDLNDKANIDGTYDGMTVGNARQLLSEKYVLDQELYLFRASGGEGSDRVEECIVGGSVAWNQMCNAASVTVTNGHKYISKVGSTWTVESSTGSAITGLTSGTDMVIDLTALFGSTIADYIYSLEQATAGAGVAWFKKYFPEDYYPYSAPTLKHVEGVSQKEVVGFNQWDEEWEVGRISTTNGQPTIATGIRSENFIQIVPNTKYYVASPENVYVIEYDASKNFVRYVDYFKNAEYTTGANASYIKFYRTDVTTYNHDICISLSDPTKNGQYEPYRKNIYPLDSTLTLRGIPKLTDGKMWFDGDKYNADGTVERRYGIVDLGTLNWTYDNSGFFCCFFDDKANTENIVCGVYMNVGLKSDYDMTHNVGDKVIGSGINNPKYVLVRDTTYTDANAFKTAMSGVYLVYELATPTTEEADPYTAIQLLDPHGTEEFVSTGIVPVGHYSKYLENLRSKIEGLPRDFSTLIAPTEKAYKATQNYTVGSLLIVNNILYKVTSAIANGGTITPNTNVTATTLAAVIAAL